MQPSSSATCELLEATSISPVVEKSFQVGVVSDKLDLTLHGTRITMVALTTKKRLCYAQGMGSNPEMGLCRKWIE